MLRAIKRVCRHLGVEIVRAETIRRLLADSRDYRRLCESVKFLGELDENSAYKLLCHVGLSKSQIQQDLFVLAVLNLKRGGYFVEFGATDGITDSNTWLLEHAFGWTGVLAEPERFWQSKLAENRNCQISSKCVWSESRDELSFVEVPGTGFSTVSKYVSADRHASRRSAGRTVSVESITLHDLLVEYEAPHKIDYLSVDTEGSELEIFKAFDFTKWDIDIISVEHNYSSQRDKIVELLGGFGYVRAPLELSRFDDWYVASRLAQRLGQVFPGLPLPQ